MSYITSRIRLQQSRDSHAPPPLISPASSPPAAKEVRVPEQPVVALYGSDAVLNCTFGDGRAFNLSELSVFWQLTDTKRSVHAFWRRRDQLADQAARFANRTALSAAGLGAGDASLLLRRVVVADEGSYTCFVRVRDYGSAALLLQVAGE
ncbi:CD276 antigen [Liparis tanakae]|uniref:CD276 antigen n=1 Tax=Liparis tanakae TaxID=230148 RepID=A0A4Z2E7X2_9TELE|nr:CD276 antigen [Liparis tanakae]